MRVLLLFPSQYLRWHLEATVHELYLPITRCGAVVEHQVFDYTFRTQEVGRDNMLVELKELTRSFKPDVILYMVTHPLRNIRPAELVDLRRDGAKILSIFLDTQSLPSEFELDYFRALDGVMIGDSLYNYIRYRLLADCHYPEKTIVYFPGHNVTPDVFHPGDGTKLYDLSHVGSVYKLREAFLTGLSEALKPHLISLTCLGGLFELDEQVVNGKVREHFRAARGYLPTAEYADAIRASRAALVIQPHPAGLRMRGKTFEMMASGSLCVAEDMKEYALTIPRETYVGLSSASDIGELVACLRDTPALERRARRGLEWFRETFDYRIFWTEVLTALRAGGSPAVRNPIARAAHDGLCQDVHVHFKGPPTEPQLLNLGLL